MDKRRAGCAVAVSLRKGPGLGSLRLQARGGLPLTYPGASHPTGLPLTRCFPVSPAALVLEPALACSMHRPSWDAHEMRPRQASAAHCYSDETSSWTADDEAQSLVQNRGFATDKYVRGSCLGIGGWSRVYKVRSVAGGRVVAGKSSEAIAEMQRESGILQSLQHDHVLKFIDWYQERGNPAATLLVTELCGHGTLQTRIDRASPNMDRIEMLQVVAQMGSALEYLHRQGLFHTDVKPRNILVRGLRPMDVVLADCADVQRMGDRRRRRQLRGTPSYYSPEMVQHGEHRGPADDVWALGVALLGMAAQWPLLRHTKQDLRRYPRRCADHAQALLALNPRHGMVRLLAGMLAPAPDRRISTRACADRASELLGGEPLGPPEYDLGIEAPRDFEPISFW